MPAWQIVLIIVGACGTLALVGIVVLAAVTFPVFARARETARRTLCASQLKQAALALSLYSMDYDERFPPAEQWQTRLRSYLPEGAATPFECPTTGPGAPGYAFNSRLARQRTATVLAPDRLPALFDTSNPRPEPADALQSFAPRHVGTGGTKVGNVAYVNGAVRSEATAPPAQGGLR